jgi:8-oxo-dGTP diphosphatase
MHARREFPEHPLVGIGGVVVEGERVLLVQRGREPLKGEWSIPGGLLELGEGLAEGVRREVKEETGLDVEPVEQLGTFDRITWETVLQGASRVRYHYVVVDYACRVKGGEIAPLSDVVDARWVAQKDLSRYGIAGAAGLAIRRAFDLSRNWDALR